MTVIVGFLCSDGAVIAADSMLTPSLGGLATGHHNARKVFLLPGDQIFAYAGDQTHAHRVKLFAELRAGLVAQADLPFDVGSMLSSAALNNFQQTHIGVKQIGCDVALAFRHGGTAHICMLVGGLQPSLLDPEHFHFAFGSGKQFADPFLSFLLDTFSPSQPTTREAVFLATWVLDHVIRTNPGGVAGPVKIAVLLSDPALGPPRELTEEEKEEQRQAIMQATAQLRTWRDTLSGLAPPPIGTEPPPLPEPA